MLVKPILEMGPAAVIFPLTNSPEDAARAVSACRYPPVGVRGFGPQRANRFGEEPLEEYFEPSETEPWLVLQIEHVQALESLDQICGVAGIDSLLVGPFDLSTSLGLPGQLTHPDVTGAFDEIARVATTHRVTIGAFAPSSDEQGISRWRDRGASWLTLDTDSVFPTGGGKAALAAANRVIGA